MTVAATPPTRFDFGRVVERTFTTLGQNLVNFTLMSALLVGAPSALFSLGTMQLVQRSGWTAQGQAQTAAGVNAMIGLLPVTVGLGLLAFLINLITSFVLQAAIVYGSIACLNGRRATLGECLSTGFRNWFWLFLLAIVMGFSEFFGFILLIVPGLMMMVAWVVAVPAQVVEHTGVFGALGRSADLTRGRRWPIFGLLLVFAIGSSVLSTVLQNLANLGTAGLVHTLNPIFATLTGHLIVAPLIRTISAVVGAVGAASIYYELRSTREGIGPEALAAVFD